MRGLLVMGERERPPVPCRIRESVATRSSVDK